jgi:hypothetical protein
MHGIFKMSGLIGVLALAGMLLAAPSFGQLAAKGPFPIIYLPAKVEKVTNAQTRTIDVFVKNRSSRTRKVSITIGENTDPAKHSLSVKSGNLKFTKDPGGPGEYVDTTMTAHQLLVFRVTFSAAVFNNGICTGFTAWVQDDNSDKRQVLHTDCWNIIK